MGRSKEMESPKLGFKRKSVLAVLLVIFVIALSLVAYTYNYIPISQRRDFVGIIRIEGYIEETAVVSRHISLISQAMANESIKAVVIEIDSGGGYVVYIEQVYLHLLALKEKKPLIASVISALSGGYYIAVAADYIYVYPTSTLGSVGVIAYAPSVLVPSELYIETGAYKWTGFTQLQFPFSVDNVLGNFLAAIEKGRGDRLKATREELKKALIYFGDEAIRLGLADEVGSLQKAVEDAARRANLTRYEVVELKPVANQTLGVEEAEKGQTSSKKLTLDMLSSLHPPPAMHYVHLPMEAVMASSPSPYSMPLNASRLSTRGTVIVDASHENKVSWWILDALIVELAKMNVTVSFLSDWKDVSAQLNNASTFIVASPTTPYSAEEVDDVDKFVRNGGLLLLLFDPAWEYIETEGLKSWIIAPINSLATRFGLSFAKGYLYNEKEYYGIYRNIYVKKFNDHTLTNGLKTLVFFTATSVHSSSGSLAWTSEETASSVAERTGESAVMASINVGNGTVTAIGDLTFLMEPYCHVEDNYKLIMNIAGLIANVSAKKAAEEKITKPNLPVGTEKFFKEIVDGRELIFRWIRKSEKEIIVEWLGRTIFYHLTKDEAIEKVTSNGSECVYESPIPEPPYPLTKGERWSHRSAFNLTLEGEAYRGEIFEEHYVKGFEKITAGDGKTYFCAKVEYTRHEVLRIREGVAKTITSGHYWVSSNAGIVKQEFLIQHFVNDTLTGVEGDVAILILIKMG